MLNFCYINYVLDYDDCTSKPCMNGGVCTDGVKTYKCACTPDYKGDNCETGNLLIVDIMLRQRGCRGRDHMVVGFITTYPISA